MGWRVIQVMLTILLLMVLFVIVAPFYLMVRNG